MAFLTSAKYILFLTALVLVLLCAVIFLVFSINNNEKSVSEHVSLPDTGIIGAEVNNNNKVVGSTETGEPLTEEDAKRLYDEFQAVPPVDTSDIPTEEQIIESSKNTTNTVLPDLKAPQIIIPILNETGN